jgi:hypothetical protein
MPRAKVLALFILAPLVITMLPSCSNSPASNATTEDEFFDGIASKRNSGSAVLGLEPATLAEAVPNRAYQFHAKDGVHSLRFSQLLVTGRITRVAPGTAYVHGGDDEIIPVDFDDERAVERTVDVTLDVLDAYDAGGRNAGMSTVTFRWGGLGGMNPSERRSYMAGIEQFGSVVVFLKPRTDRDGPVWIPAMQGALWGQYDEPTGLVSFPGLGNEERAFSGSVTTLEALRSLANKPSSMTKIVVD